MSELKWLFVDWSVVSQQTDNACRIECAINLPFSGEGVSRVVENKEVHALTKDVSNTAGGRIVNISFVKARSSEKLTRLVH